MPRILLVKTSSLGDVVHNLPVASDIASAVPGTEIHWVVEESFTALPALHRAVGKVIPVAIRRWRKSPWKAATRSEIAAFATELRAVGYDAVIDTQGLLKSALIARVARGTRYGLDWKASREPLFPFYDHTFHVPRTLHAVERNRRLAARALGYTLPPRVDYGIAAPRAELAWLPARAYAVLVHSTSAGKKLWPEERWIALGQALARQGLVSVLPWGGAEERGRAERLAGAIPDAVTPPQLTLGEAASVLAGAQCVAGLDTGLTHLAGALGVGTIGIYTATGPAVTGLYGCARAASIGGIGASPTVEDVLAALRKVAA